MNAIKPVETHWAGRRFRSRLEARWAVFFETLGWRWDYESEGYEVGGAYSGRSRIWLPDFEVVTPTGDEFYVEVKGNPGAYRKGSPLRHFWFDMDFGRCPPRASVNHDGPLKPMMLLGKIPHVVSADIDYAVPVIHHRKGMLLEWHKLKSETTARATFNYDVNSCPNDGPDDFQVTRLWSDNPDTGVLKAILVAASARFEHGEKPARRARR